MSEVTFFGQDEVVGVQREYFGSCWKMLKTELIDDIGTDDGHFLMLPVKSDDYSKDCKEFIEELESRGGIDLLIVGIGENGHIGFNEPDDHFSKGTHCVDLTESTIQANSRLFDSIDDVPRQAYTMGTQTIMYARMILVVANGEAKAQAVHDMCYGPVTPECPASILQLHTNCVVVADEAALSLCPAE